MAYHRISLELGWSSSVTKSDPLDRSLVMEATRAGKALMQAWDEYILVRAAGKPVDRYRFLDYFGNYLDFDFSDESPGS